MNYTFTQRFKVDPIDADGLSDHCDQIMDALLDLDGVTDPWIAGAMARGTVEIGVMVSADSYLRVMEAGTAFIRTAIHAAEEVTPDGPRLDETTLRSTMTEVVAEADVPLGG